MADISQVKLPDGTTYNLKDSYVRTNYRALSNNDFDTINVTELNAGDLVVTGAARFLNTINGSVSGTSSNVTGTVAIANGGTGATSAANARTNLGLGSAAVKNIVDTYTSTSTDAISGKGVAAALGTLDGTVTGSPSASKTLTAFSQTDGKVSATFGNISITKSQVSDFPTLGTAAAKNYTTSVSSGSADLVTSGAVWTAIDNLPEPMVFKGSLGTGGTITALPVDGTAKVGDTYKVITAGTYASKAAKVGDTFICLTKTSSANTWELIPSGDEPSGTVTSVGISNGGGLSVSGSPITSSGTITISHADTSSQASVNNSGRTYIQDITLDTYGHVTGITSATETVVNTDRYVNSAAFAHDSTNDNVKMTLTRAGSDTATVTANIPKVSNSSAGVAPKGATVSSQSQTTKFLREDGTWQVPSYTPVIDNLTSSTSTTSALSAKQGYLLANGSARDNTKLPLAGGTMTGTPKFATSSISEFSGNVPFILGIEAFADGGEVKWKASSNVTVGTATSATSAKQLSSFASISGSSHADALKTYFDENKSNVPRNQIIDFYSTAYGNGSQYMGYFLSGYDTNPYGGFYVAHYNTPYYVGIQSGSYSQSKLGRFPTNPTSGQIIIADGTDGVLKSSGYTIATSVPSGAVFTDTKNTAGSTDTSSKIFLIGATSQAANPQTYSDDQVYVTSGTLQTNNTYATVSLCANTGNSGTAGGVSLYGSSPTAYGLAMRGTGNGGKHGAVQGDWAIYSYMNGYNTARGWIWRNSYSNNTNIASLDVYGNAVFNGYVGIGGNETNTSGVRQVYNSTTKSLDFVFVA